MKTKPFALIRIIISLSFIGLLLWIMRDRWTQILEIINNIDSALLVAGVAIFILGLVIISFRLKYLLGAEGLLLKSGEAASLTFIGYFFNNFLPTSMGGDLVKAYYASRKTSNKLGCFATVFMDRLFGIFCLFLIAASAAVLTHAYVMDSSITWPIFLVLLALVVFFSILWNKKLAQALLSPVVSLAKRVKAAQRLGLEEKLKRVYATINGFKDKKRVLVKVFVISILAQLVSFTAVYFWLKGLGSPVSMRIVLMTMPLVAILSVLPSINGLGIREYAMVFFFEPYIGRENAFTLSLLWLLALFVASIIGGLNYAFGSQYRLKPIEPISTPGVK